MTTKREQLLTIVETAEWLNMSAATVQRWAYEGKLPAVRLGKEYRIRPSDLEAWYNDKLRYSPIERT